MDLTKEAKQKIIDAFKRNLTMSEIAVIHGIGTLVVEGIIREWVVEQERKVLHHH